jgi:hypothetical protein
MIDPNIGIYLAGVLSGALGAFLLVMFIHAFSACEKCNEYETRNKRYPLGGVEGE